MSKEQIKVEVQGRMLIISGERKSENKQQKENINFQEINYGSFLRTIALPQDAKIKEISSEYAKGVLTIKIPKESSKPMGQEKIKVQVR